MKKAIILLSGGLDSTTCLAYAKAQGYACFALSFEYGQKHNAELQASKKIATHVGVEKHEVISLPIGHLGGSALTDAVIKIPDYSGSTDIPVTYVPARNTIFLAIALGWAERVDADFIYIGVSAVDYSGYPDCRPEFINAFQHVAQIGTVAGIEGRGVKIETPLIQLSKAETIKLGHSLGVDYAMTISCYQATTDGSACGHCDSCVLRKRGFQEANVADPTRYV